MVIEGELNTCSVNSKTHRRIKNRRLNCLPNLTRIYSMSGEWRDIDKFMHVKQQKVSKLIGLHGEGKRTELKG